MSGRVELHPDAKADIREAMKWYDRQAAGLGKLLVFELHRMIDRIGRFPEAYPQFKASVRRAALARFPYQVFYLDSDDRIIVIAMMHLRRDRPSIEDHLSQRYHP